MSNSRVVITGMGVLAPNAHGLTDFENALREGTSGIRHIPSLKQCNFKCQSGGVPKNFEKLKTEYFSEELRFSMNSHMVYAGVAGIDCWRDAGFEVPPWNHPEVEWDTGAIIGTGVGGVETLEAYDCERKVKEGHVRKLGGILVEQTMMSAASAKLNGLLALGGHTTTNSTACATSTEAIAEGYFHVQTGRAKRMLVGGTEGGTDESAPFIWAGFEGMRILARKFHDQPEKASRPLSQTATGFVPAAGAGVLLLERLDSAEKRGAKIYAEIIGAHVNSGGQRNGGSMTAANPEGVIRCIRSAVQSAKIQPHEIDAINGHLTATIFDTQEIETWQRALEVSSRNFPWINATKSLVGHALGAAGAIECIATVLQLKNNFLHPSINCEDVHSKILPIAHRIPHQALEKELSIIAKASFGFGDINASVIFKKWSP